MQIFLPRRVKYYKPLVYAELPGQKQMAGRRIGVSLPEDAASFDPQEHIRDLGPEDPANRQAALIIPGMGELDHEEIADLTAAIREKNAKREATGVHAERLGRNPARFNQVFREHIDRVARGRIGKKTYGPGTMPIRAPAGLVALLTRGAR